MSASENLEEAVEVLQQLGLKEYEARCFVGLSRMSTGTAKQLSEMTEVPRTRVYDAIRVLEAQGLVEIQHTSPQRYRAVPLEVATETLRDQYETRVERLRDSLGSLDVIEEEDESPVQEVWAMSGREAIENRTNELIRDAKNEIVLVLGDSSLLTEEIVSNLTKVGTGVDLVIGALNQPLREEIEELVPNATTFVSGLGWLESEDNQENETAIGRLLLIDRSVILVSSIISGSGEERAIFGDGFGNGLVVVARRLMAQGLIETRDPRT